MEALDGFRPVLHLESGVKVLGDSSHDGTTEDKAYTLQAAD